MAIWREQLKNLQATQTPLSVLPQMSSWRTPVPDISNLIFSSLPYLPKLVYINLTILNNAIRQLEEQGVHILNIFDLLITIRIDYDVQVKLATNLISLLESILRVIDTAKKSIQDKSLMKWLNIK